MMKSTLKHSNQVAELLKAEGFLIRGNMHEQGFPELMGFKKDGRIGFISIKRHGTLTREQTRMLTRLSSHGFDVFVAEVRLEKFRSQSTHSSRGRR